MLSGLRPSYLAKFCGFFVVYVCLSFVVVRQIPDNYRSQLFPQSQLSLMIHLFFCALLYVVIDCFGRLFSKKNSRFI